ncbi:hypothetical protein [Rhizobium sp. CNPSo 4039]|uniref:hypothetical protein n=1 Tax=Rhizobium sp. CNPSo 4039 TaxID=3021409 RepID=UPI0033064AE7
MKDATTGDLVTYSGAVLAGLRERVVMDLADLFDMERRDDPATLPLPQFQNANDPQASRTPRTSTDQGSSVIAPFIHPVWKMTAADTIKLIDQQDRKPVIRRSSTIKQKPLEFAIGAPEKQILEQGRDDLRPHTCPFIDQHYRKPFDLDSDRAPFVAATIPPGIEQIKPILYCPFRNHLRHHDVSRFGDDNGYCAPTRITPLTSE